MQQMEAQTKLNQQAFEQNIVLRDEAREYSRKALDFLVEDAERAGFNPLTVLRAGGGSTYNAASTFAPLSRTAATVPAQTAAPNARQNIGASMQEIGNQWLANWDPYKEQAQTLANQLTSAQINNLNASTSQMNRSFQVPSMRVSQSPSRVAMKTASMSRTQAQKKMGTGAGPNGEILNIWTDWYDRGGAVVQLPNPNLPESEQFLVPPLGKIENTLNKPVEEWWYSKPSALPGGPGGGWTYAKGTGGLVKYRQQTPAEKAASESSWLPSWVPTVEMNWQ